MSDDVLLVILSYLPIKDVVITSGLSTRWRFLWRNMDLLNFDSCKTLGEISNVSERSKYVNHVNCIIGSYNCPEVQVFRIQFNLSCYNKEDIDKWLQFATNKKVEMLELDLGNTNNFRGIATNYEFPLKLWDMNIARLFKWQQSAVFVELLCLKKLYLKSVNVTNRVFLDFLTNSPNLEMISIHGLGYLKHVHVGRRDLKLKHLEIVQCSSVKSIYLSDFDLVSFTYEGPPIDIRLTHLPKLREVDMCQGFEGLNGNVISQISSFALSLQAIFIYICDNSPN